MSKRKKPQSTFEKEMQDPVFRKRFNESYKELLLSEKVDKINDFANQFGLKLPVIIQAPMAGGITTPELVAAVSNAGGLGTFATGYLKTEEVETGIRKIKQLTSKPFSVNVFIPNTFKQDINQIKSYQEILNKFRRELNIPEENDVPSELLSQDNFHEIIDILLRENIKIVSFAFGNLPIDIINRFKKADIYLMGTATSLEEAKILSDADVDAIVAQGYEAGGHRGGFHTPHKQASIGTMALIPRLVESIRCPIIAAGGIMNGRSILAAIALGASAVHLGTAFLATKESGANAIYKAELKKMKDIDYDATTLTAAYSGKMARGIHTDFIEYVETHASAIPPYPIANILSTPLRKEATKQKAKNIMSMWSGQGVSLIRSDITVDDLMQQLRNEIKASLEDLESLHDKL